MGISTPAHPVQAGAVSRAATSTSCETDGRPSPRSLLQRARELARSADDWPVRPRFTFGRRWYAPLAADERGEAWLLSWLPGQHTDWHDHGGSAGAFVVVSGSLTELVPTGEGAVVQSRLLRAGAGRSFGASHVHRVSNDGDLPAVSIHVYAPVLAAMTRYQLDDDGLQAIGVERAGSDW